MMPAIRLGHSRLSPRVLPRTSFLQPPTILHWDRLLSLLPRYRWGGGGSARSPRLPAEVGSEAARIRPPSQPLPRK